jgi:hypothetical protein
MGDARVWKQVKYEARESLARFLQYETLEGVAEALRNHSRGSQRVSGGYSSSTLKLMR